MRIGWGPALGRVQDPGHCDRARVIWFTRKCMGSYLVSCLAPCLRARVFPFYARSLRRHATRTLVFPRQEVPGEMERGGGDAPSCAPSTTFHDPS
jgi:hypothetical protein